MADYAHVLANACLRQITPERFIAHAAGYVSADQHEEARELLMLGLPPVIVAQRVGMTAKAVRRLSRSLGMYRRPRHSIVVH